MKSPKVNSIATTTSRTLGSYGSNPAAGPAYVFPKNWNIPAGQYHATVDKIVPSTSSSGNPAIDVCYTLKGPQSKVYHMRQRIAQGTPYMDTFLDVLSKAGVNVSKVKPGDVSNIPLDIDLDYDENGFGHITFPQPTVGRVISPQRRATMTELLADDEAEDELDEEDIEVYLEQESE